MNFRDLIRQVSPRWLGTGLAEKILYSLFIPVDAITVGLASGIKLRFPNVLSDESLPYIGRDRKIVRGRTESAENYSGRLTRWWDDHKTRGGPYALLAQCMAFFGEEFNISLLYTSGRWFYADKLNVTRSDVTYWDPPTHWSYYYLIYHVPNPIAGDGVWGDSGVWDDDYVWDSELSVAAAQDYRTVPQQWSPAHTQGEIILLSSQEDLWNFPPGTWDDWDENNWLGNSPPRIGIN